MYMPAGVWSDDTSLTLATMDSIIKSNRLDYKDMADRFCLFMNKG
ncbi:MAG: ADP-ribosylglycohydrolase family protein, partial [Clostridiales bacterium]|nr:ADP-ribosylglycohydrolase family protein [Clostridiales bacterium]